MNNELGSVFCAEPKDLRIEISSQMQKQWSQNDGLWHVWAFKRLRFNISLAQHLHMFFLAFGAGPCRPAYEQPVPAKACIELKTPL